IIVVLIWWAARRDSPPPNNSLTRILLPAATVMATALAALGYYFYRVTGSPFTIPYKLNMDTYGLVFFPWEKIKPVTFRHEIFQQFYRGGPVVGVHAFALHHPLQLQFYKATTIWLFFFGPLLTVPGIIWLFTRPRGGFWKSFCPDLRFILVFTVIAYIPLMLTIYVGQPHYAAPMTASFYVFTLLMMRDVYTHAPGGRRAGPFLARSVPVICVLLFVVRAGAPAVHLAPKPGW